MNITLIRRIVGALVFVISFVSYLLTTYPSLSFWDCGEFIATTHSLSVPHAPGAPFFALYSKVISLIPYVSNYAQRINIISCVASAATVTFVYFISVMLIAGIRGRNIKDIKDAVILFGSSAIGALALAWSDTFWFNAVEAEVYASSMLFLSWITWLGLRWYEAADERHSERYLLLIAYLLGLSIGIHQLSLLAYFWVALIVYVRKYKYSLKSFFLFVLAAIGIFLIIYPGIVLWLPNLLDGKLGEQESASVLVQLLPLLIVLATLYGMYYSYKTRHVILNLSLTSGLLIILGYSTYTLVMIRAGEHPPINEVNPDNLDRLVQYLNREQYGNTPLLRGATYSNRTGRVETDADKKVFFPRRWSADDIHTNSYQKYKGDGDYFIRYQFHQMFLRYLFWNFIGRAGDIQDAPAYFAGAIQDGPENGKWTLLQNTFPNAYYGIPFILGLIGFLYQFKKDWKFGLSSLALFLVLGAALVFYFNMAQPQPRERDYFFVGAFLIFAVWISLGASAILQFLETRLPNMKVAAIIGCLLLLLIAPVNMAYQNWFDHDRSGDWIPWDLSYNTLQSCEKDAILFTNGDNDTFPLWYLQEVEGIRRDVRVICLSLLNTDWYSLQLKNEKPYGAQTVPISYTDEQIIRWSTLDDESVLQTGWREEKKKISAPVSTSVYTEFKKQNAEGPSGLIMRDTTATKEGEMQWISKARFPIRDLQGNMLYIRQWQDIMIEDIVKTNGWQRPIYFSVTCTPDAFIGLDNFLRMEGLALRVTPIEGSPNTYVQYASMYDHLFNTQKTLSTTPQRGFAFRNLNNPNYYIDDNAQRLMVNYRNAYLRLAIYQLQIAKDSAAVVKTLDRMLEVMPLQTMPIDYRLQYDVASIYLEAGAGDRYKSLAFQIEKQCWAEIAKNPTEMSSFYSPYRFLLEMYQQDKKYANAIAVLDTILKYHPGANDVQTKRDELTTLMNNKK